MNKIYLIPGLGADKRVFEYLKIASETISIDWVTPGRDETLPDYCSRLIETYHIEKNQVLLGLSFGGLVAIELARLTSARAVILISSIKNQFELPWLFHLAGNLHLHKLVPYSWLKKPNFMLRFAFSPIAEKDYDLLKKIVADTDASFLEWAINQVVLFSTKTSAEHIIHIHGTGDKIFPRHFIKDYIAIKRGGHFMVVNRAEEISSIINKHISQLS